MMTIDTKKILSKAINLAEKNNDGMPAGYIPQLAEMDANLLGMTVNTMAGETYSVGNVKEQLFTLQSVSKLVVLIGMLEEQGADNVFSWVLTEPSGDDFASVARLDQFGPHPSNPMLNAGAITLCSHIEGDAVARQQWLERWMATLFGAKLNLNASVFLSEKESGDRNRALTYLLKDNHMIAGDVNQVLETYFRLCSFEVSMSQAAYLPTLLANGGQSPSGEQIISTATVEQVVALMATCGLYNESGEHLVKTGMPAKSGVSGLIIAVAPGKAGVAVFSPRVNLKGTSIRAEIMLEYVSKQMGWHFAS
tara:strand:- start:15793 stop:16716 length:924 start_codon:yes stop_codon:yes gene_type:complete